MPAAGGVAVVAAAGDGSRQEPRASGLWPGWSDFQYPATSEGSSNALGRVGWGIGSSARRHVMVAAEQGRPRHGPDHRTYLGWSGPQVLNAGEGSTGASGMERLELIMRSRCRESVGVGTRLLISRASGDRTRRANGAGVTHALKWRLGCVYPPPRPECFTWNGSMAQREIFSRAGGGTSCGRTDR